MIVFSLSNSSAKTLVFFCYSRCTYNFYRWWNKLWKIKCFISCVGSSKTSSFIKRFVLFLLLSLYLSLFLTDARFSCQSAHTQRKEKKRAKEQVEKTKIKPKQKLPNDGIKSILLWCWYILWALINKANRLDSNYASFNSFRDDSSENTYMSDMSWCIVGLCNKKIFCFVSRSPLPLYVLSSSLQHLLCDLILWWVFVKWIVCKRPNYVNPLLDTERLLETPPLSLVQQQRRYENKERGYELSRIQAKSKWK